MENLNEMELQTLRHLIMAHDTVSCKMESYAKEAQSPDVQQYFQKAAQTEMCIRDSHWLLLFLSVPAAAPAASCQSKAPANRSAERRNPAPGPVEASFCFRAHSRCV